MPVSTEQMLTRAAAIRDAVLAGENTATRVGSLLWDIIEFLATNGNAREAYHALFAHDLDPDSPVRDQFLSKVKDDRTAHKIASDLGFEVGRYLAGVSGGMLGMDAETGESFAEVFKLYVRGKAFFETLTIIEAATLAGRHYITPGGSIKCSKVEEVTDSSGAVTAYRCWFLSEQDGEKTETKIIPGDQAISEMFNAKTGTANKVSNHRYWRLVTAVDNAAETDPSGNVYGYIDLSATDCEADSDIPKAGDAIEQFGSRDDATRQTAMMFDTVGADAPSIKMFSGIDSYSLTDKAIISFGRDPATNKVFFRIGATGAAQYLDYNQEKGLALAGRLSLSSTLDDDGTTLGDALKASIEDTDVLYISHNSDTTPPALPVVGTDGSITDLKGWSTTAPARQEGMYIWQCTYIKRGDGTARFAGPTCLSGTDGRGIDKIEEEYYLSTSATQLLGGSWVGEAPAWQPGMFTWTRSKITYSDGTVEYTDAVCVTGTPGTSVLAEYSEDAVSWHPTMTSTDIYMRTSDDGGTTWSGPIRMVGQDGKDGQYRLYQWAKNNSATSAPTSGWQGTPMTAAAGEYVWQRSGIVIPPATAPASWDNPVRLTGDKGEKGADGQSVYMLDIDDEVSGIACNASGTVTGSYPSPQASVFKGATKLTSGVTYSIAQKSGISTASIDASGKVSLSGMSADTAAVTVRAVVDGVTLTSVISLYKVKPGQTGTAAVVYSIEPSVSNITKSMTGALSTTSITCNVYKTTGNTSRAATSDHTLYYQRIPDMSAPATLVRVTGTVAIQSTTEAVIFELRDASGAVLDRERVPVIADASDMEMGGRNLLLKSGVEHSNTSYPTAIYDLTVKPKTGETFTITLWGLLAAAKTEFRVFNTNGNNPLATLKKVSEGVYQATFKWNNGENGSYPVSDPKTIHIYPFLSTQSGTSTINRIKLERGNVPTDWTPAPEDISERVDTFDYLKEAMRNGKTEFQGGLMLSRHIRLGHWTSTDENGTLDQVWAGMNGIYHNAKTVASWWGGDMVDRFYDDNGNLRPTPLSSGFAAALVRMDGTGYFVDGLFRIKKTGLEIGDTANGYGISMGMDGRLTLGNGISINIGGEAKGLGDSIASLTTLLNSIGNMFDPVLVGSDGNVIYKGWEKISEANAIRANKAFFTVDWLSGYGVGANAGAGGTGGSVEMLKAWADYSTSDADVKALSAGLGYDLHTRVNALASRNYLDALTLAATGSGNAVTDVSLSTDHKTLTVNKGGNYLWMQDDHDFDPSTMDGYYAGMTTHSGIGGDWWHILSMNWGTGRNNVGKTWVSQLALPTQQRNGVYYRSGASASAYSPWVRLLDEGNYASILGNAYQPKGDYVTIGTNQTITGTKTFGAGILFSPLSGTNSRELIRQQMADNDYFRILCGGTATNAGFVEIATADDGTEPIYVRQYNNTGGIFGTIVHDITLIDSNGNQKFNTVRGASFIRSGGTSSQFLMADGSVATKHVLTASNNLGWNETQGQIPTIDTLAFWNGRYNAASSNLQYCDRGRFGDIVTHSHSEYVTALGTSGNSLTWTKNGAVNNITVPYASTSGWLNPNTSLTYGVNGLQYFNIYGTQGNDKSNCTPTREWYHIIRLNHSNSAGYLADIAVPLNDVSGLYWRQIRTGAFYGWFKLLDSNNYSSILDGRYYTESEINTLFSLYYNKSESDDRFVNVAGDTMTGNLTLPAIYGSGAGGQLGFGGWLYLNSSQFTPYIASNGVMSLGKPEGRWANVYATTINVTSSALVSNLNADLLDGRHAEGFSWRKYLGYHTDGRGAYVILSHAYNGTILSGSLFMGTVYITRGNSGAWNGKTAINVQCGGQYNSNIANYQVLNSSVSIAGLYKIVYNGTAYIALKMDGTSSMEFLVEGWWRGIDPVLVNDNNAGVTSEVLLTNTPSMVVNASSATKLQTARTINGTSFDGSSNIVTSYWGATRTLWGQSCNGSGNVSGDMSGVGNIKASGTINCAALEISHSTPYIDFHFGNSSADYTSRIIENASGVLSVTGGFNIGKNLDVAGSTTLHGSLLYNSGDASMKIYSLANSTQPTSYGKETVAIQTSFDAQDPETGSYPPIHTARTLLSLQPRGGRVAIGKDNAAYTLDVNGDIRADGWLRTTGAQGWYSQTYGGGWFMEDSTWVKVWNNKSIFTSGVIRTDGQLQVGANGDKFLADSAGKVKAAGEIISTSANAFRMVQGDYGAFWRNDGRNTWLLLTASGDQYGSFNNLRPIMVDNVYGGVTLGGNTLVVGHNAYVGVKTTSPTCPLDVNGDTRIRGKLRMDDGTNYGGKINFGDADQVYLWESSDDALDIYAANSLTLQSDEVVNVESDYLIVKSGCRVGIGASSPAYPLDVAGNARVQNILYATEIRLGPLIIKYDAAKKAVTVTGGGIYCDSYITAYGV